MYQFKLQIVNYEIYCKFPYVQKFKTVALLNTEADSGYPRKCVIWGPKPKARVLDFVDSTYKASLER
jgi:hypothetical protein